jgi:hypothetical protein
MKKELTDLLKVKHARYVSEPHLEKNHPGLLDWILGETDFLEEDVSIAERIFCIHHEITEHPKCPNCGKKVRKWHGAKTSLTSYKHGTCSTSCSKLACTNPNVELPEDVEHPLDEEPRKLSRNLAAVIVARRKVRDMGLDHTQMTSRECLHVAIVGTGNGCAVCGELTTFDDQKMKYRKHCSSKCAANNHDTVSKRKITNLEKYGHENVFGSEEVKETIRQTHLGRRGVDHHAKVEGYKFPKVNREKVAIARKKTTYKSFKRFEDVVVPEFSEEEFLGGGYHKLYEWRCKTCDNVYKSWYHNGTLKECPICNVGTKSEREILEFLGQNKIRTEVRSRKIIPPFEIDIYVPDHKLAIEVNGLYWHSEKVIGTKDHHLNKTLECEKRGIRLIQLFEDEWKIKQKIVKDRLSYVLGLKRSSVIGARKCKITEIDSRSKNSFLSEHHIQEADRSSIKLGAFVNDDLVGVMTFCKQRRALGRKNVIEGQWELSRFATDGKNSYPGLASKMLKRFKETNDWNEIVTYADRRWSQGNVYEQMGFTLSHSSKPNYWYTPDYHVRFHRFNFAKHMLQEKLGDQFDSDLSERENMEKAGYVRIWDCGNLVYVMENDEV